ncbi:MAG: hypothetical protein DDT19_01351 [Syntrophomonadaceae bacterium]|nr:hypothetical protein [Bacillota bacterium]
MTGKKWWKSRTIWANALALIATVSAGAFGFEISSEEIAAALVVINVILRIITKEAIVW